MSSRTSVTRLNSGGTQKKQLELAEFWVIGVDWIFNLPCLKQKKKTTTKGICKEQPQKSHEQGILPKKNLQIDRSFFASYRTHTMNYFCVFGDFYASGTQDAEVTKSLLLRYQFRHSYSVLLRSVTVPTDTHPPQERAATPLWHSFGCLCVYVICQIMARERLQLTSRNLAIAKINMLMKDFDWQVKCDACGVAMATWTIEYNLKISLFLS